MAAVVLAVATACLAVSCGDDEASTTRDDVREVGRAMDTAADVAREDPSDRQPDPSMAASARDWGPRRDRRRIVAVFVGMQRDFRAGRMGAVCAQVLNFAIEQFTPGDTDADTPCPAKLRAFAGELQRRGVRPVRLRLLAVRAYPLVTSIWVEEPNGRRIRIPFGDYENTGMKLELGSFRYRETLHGRLAGAAAYLRR